MENASKFRDKLRRGQIPLGGGVSFTDPTVCELFSHVLDVCLDRHGTQCSFTGNRPVPHHGNQGQ